MIRKLVVLMVVGGTVLLVAPAAWAKCDPDADLDHGGCVEITSADATISGPGMGIPLTISGPPVFDIVRQAGVDGYTPYNSDPMAQFPGQDELGPRYEVLVEVSTEAGEAYSFTMDVYPYAENLAVPGAPSAWVFLPGVVEMPLAERIGGRLFTFGEVQGKAGWWKSSALYYTLTGEGLPHDPPALAGPAAASVGERAADDATSSQDVRAGLILASLAVVLILAVLAGRRRGAVA